jgi:hypothetical protein
MQTIYYKGQYININFNTNLCYVVFYHLGEYSTKQYKSFIGAKRGITKFIKYNAII